MDEKKIVYLTVGKEVSLSFSGEFEKLKYIRLSLNKVAELLNNELIDSESIFDIDEVCLITKSNYRTVVKVIGNKQELQGNNETVNVRINKDKTRQRKKGKNLLTSGDFIFVVDQNQSFKQEDLYNLNSKNVKKYENERR